MASRSEAALRAKRDAQMKKVLICLAPLLLGLLAWQGPKTFKAITGGNAATPPPAATTPAPTTTAPTPPTGTTPVGGAGGGLPESDLPVNPGTGQLITFTRFVGRDPFRARPGAPSSGTTPPAGNPAANSASLEVNGTAETVEVGDSFPASDPVFKLVSLASDSATVGLVSGSFSNGQDTLAVNVGETLVLMSDPDGTRYAIKLLGVA